MKTDKKKVDAFLNQLESFQSEDWDRIPDIGMYMDQLKSYMIHQHLGLELEGTDETLTSSMINNYIKSGILPRAEKKRYSREHVGILTAICLLKQVLRVDEVGTLLELLRKDSNPETFYKEFTALAESNYREVAEEIKEKSKEDDIAAEALSLAVSGYARILACKTLLDSMDEEK